MSINNRKVGALAVEQRTACGAGARLTTAVPPVVR
jgi:hypothetical protein